ncbi:unnamed protein product [Sphagnum balticum]
MTFQCMVVKRKSWTLLCSRRPFNEGHMSVEETLEALHQPSQKETNLNIPEAAMRDHLPLDQDEAVGSLPVSNIWASTATPQLKLGELIERTKHMARGGGETQENDRFDDKDTMVETGNDAAHQLEGLLEDLEVDIESPSRLDSLLETPQKDLEVG